MQVELISFSLKMPGSFVELESIQGLPPERVEQILLSSAGVSSLLHLVENALMDASHALARYRVIRQALDAGASPRPFVTLAAFYARGYVYALKRMRSLIEKLQRWSEVAAAATSALGAIDKKFPHLTRMRDSSAHFDDRAVAEGKPVRGVRQPLTLAAIQEAGFTAAAGAVVVVESFRGDVFESTDNAGKLVGIPVTEDSFRACVLALQELINRVRWVGEPGEIRSP